MLVLDTWPVMEWLSRKQPAADGFEALLLQHQTGEQHLCISRMNWGELYYSLRKSQDRQFSEDLIRMLPELALEIVSVEDHHVNAAARLKATYNISYADAFAAALSIERNAPLATGDREFLTLEKDGILQLHWLGA